MTHSHVLMEAVVKVFREASYAFVHKTTLELDVNLVQMNALELTVRMVEFVKTYLDFHLLNVYAELDG